jgi:hypothetical protein
MFDTEARHGWHRIGRVLHDRIAETVPPYVPPPPCVPIDPLTLATKLVALAKQYDEDAREAQQAAASCRQYASALRAGIE